MMENGAFKNVRTIDGKRYTLYGVRNKRLDAIELKKRVKNKMSKNGIKVSVREIKIGGKHSIYYRTSKK